MVKLEKIAVVLPEDRIVFGQNSIRTQNNYLGMTIFVQSNNAIFSFFVEKAQQYLSSEEDDFNKSSRIRKARKTFCTMVTRINNASHTIGKDGKVSVKSVTILVMILVTLMMMTIMMTTVTNTLL